MRAALADGDTAAARRHAEGIRTLARDLGNRVAEATATLGTAHADLAAGDAGSAEMRAREAFGIGLAARLPAHAVAALDLLGEIAVVRGRPAQAACLVAAADAAGAAARDPYRQAAYAAVRRAVDGALDVSERDAAYAQGAGMTLDDVAGYLRRTRGKRVRADRGGRASPRPRPPSRGWPRTGCSTPRSPSGWSSRGRRSRCICPGCTPRSVSPTAPNWPRSCGRYRRRDALGRAGGTRAGRRVPGEARARGRPVRRAAGAAA